MLRTKANIGICSQVEYNIVPLNGIGEACKIQSIALNQSKTCMLQGIIKKLARWPRAGDGVELGDYHVKVVAVANKRITQVLISPTTQEAARKDGPGVA